MKYDFPNTGRAIVIKDDKILLIERWREELHYFSIPGGGIEADETPEQTAIREVKEETSLDIIVERLIYKMLDGKREHFIFLCSFVDGKPYLPADSEEAQTGPNNRYEPRWVPIDEVGGLNLGYWQPLHSMLSDDLINGFSESVKITAVTTN